MTEYRIGIYIRLSLADEDTGSGKAESDSVGNQQELIHQFLDRHPQLKAAPGRSSWTMATPGRTRTARSFRRS